VEEHLSGETTFSKGINQNEGDPPQHKKSRPVSLPCPSRGRRGGNLAASHLGPPLCSSSFSSPPDRVARQGAGSSSGGASFLPSRKGLGTCQCGRQGWRAGEEWAVSAVAWWLRRVWVCPWFRRQCSRAATTSGYGRHRLDPDYGGAAW
jgi:hypothetical protein